MAEYHIRNWRLCVLRVRLDLSQTNPVVVVTLVSFEDEEPRGLWQQRYDPRDFGIPPDGAPTTLRLPPALGELVASSFWTNLSRETALWLRLMPPYGYLGAAPWESELIPLIDRPLLRVPDRMPAAADFGTRWTAVVALAARPGSNWAPEYVIGFLDQLRSQVGDLLDVHVFADALTAAGVADLRAPEDWWHLHDPHTVPRPGTARPARWSDWIRTGLEGHAVRALHVVTDAVFDGELPMLLVPADPMDPDPARAGYVQIESALRLADTIGAATLSFGSPPDNISDAATRMLADDLGQRRPGPTLYSSIADDPIGSALASTHAYLADPQTNRLPVSQSQFLYAQPEHVVASLVNAWPTAGRAITSRGDEVLPSMPAAPPMPGRPDVRMSPPQPSALPTAVPDGVELEPEDPLTREVPAWVAAGYGFLKAAYHRASLDQQAGAVDAAYVQGVTEAIDDLHALIDRETP